MTWPMTICHHMTYVTSHDVKAWLHEHKIWHLTSSICRCEWTGAMILLLFRTIFRSRNTFLLSSIGWPSRVNSRVTLKRKVTPWSTWPLLSLLVFVLPRWFWYYFVMILGQGNSFQLSPFVWTSRLTLKLNVTSWSTWHMPFLPVFVLPSFCYLGPSALELTPIGR